MHERITETMPLWAFVTAQAAGVHACTQPPVDNAWHGAHPRSMPNKNHKNTKQIGSAQTVELGVECGAKVGTLGGDDVLQVAPMPTVTSSG